jgi:hypothetical protein
MDFSSVPSFVITDEYLVSVVKCLRASKLIVPFAQRVSDAGIMNAILHLSNLKELSLEGNLKCASDLVLEAVAAHAPNLESLNLSGCIKTTFQGLKMILLACSNLQVLKIGSLNKNAVNGELLRFLAKTKINALGLHNCLLTDSDMQILAENLNSKLIDLDLSYCESIKDQGIEYISKKCPNIKRLKLYGLSEITNVSLSMIGNSLFKLEDLDLSMCVKITDSGLAGLVVRGTLKHLKLFGCKCITSISLQHLSSNCKKLETLSLYGNEDISEGAVMDMVFACEKLYRIDLGSCKKISKEFTVRVNNYRSKP